MPAPNKLLESKEANPELLTNGLHTVNIEQRKQILRRTNVKAIPPLEMGWNEFNLPCRSSCVRIARWVHRLAWLWKVLNRTGPIGKMNPIMRNKIWNEKIFFFLDLRLTWEAWLGNFHESRMPNSHVNQIHLQHFISSFFNPKLTYLLQQKRCSPSSKSTVFSSVIISHSFNFDIF